jgi:hypothetical protein
MFGLGACLGVSGSAFCQLPVRPLLTDMAVVVGSLHKVILLWVIVDSWLGPFCDWKVPGRVVAHQMLTSRTYRFLGRLREDIVMLL